ncbi:hypothetical protein Tco_1258435 [Tanacetum coccineum]
MYTISSSFGLGATSRGSSDKCCFSCLKACSASGVQWKSLFLMHFFKVLNSGKDFSADLERNLFRLGNFPLRLWTSLIVRGDGSRSKASVLSGHGFIPFGLIMYPKNIPSTAPNVHFLGLSFILIFRNVQNVSSLSLSISVSVSLNNQVIDVHFYVPTNLAVKSFVHQPLVCGASVLEAEGHFGIAIYSMTGVESRFLFI